MRRKLIILVVVLGMLAMAVPAGAALDEGGGSVPTPVVSASDGGFDWADAGIGAGMALALVGAAGVVVAARRHDRARQVGTPATR